MVGKKRPLAELDPNTTSPSKKSKGTKPPTSDEKPAIKRGRRTKADPPSDATLTGGKFKWGNNSTRYSSSTTNPARQSGEQIEYKTKDNGKLRALLVDRNMPIQGTRDELIQMLETSSIDYESMQSCQLNDMLRRRGLRMACSGTKETKIKRLRNNDKLDRDTGPHGESTQHGLLSAYEMVLDDAKAKESTPVDYASYSQTRLTRELDKRGLSQTGGTRALVSRLCANDKKIAKARIKKLENIYNSAKSELEVRTGRSFNSVARVLNEENVYNKVDSDILQNASYKAKGPICDYDWSQSHWASRTERELTEICRRREMPGFGPKAAMLKWLDTGSVNYNDLYMSSLQKLCGERGIKCTTKHTRLQLAEMLEIDDQKASNSA